MGWIIKDLVYYTKELGMTSTGDKDSKIVGFVTVIRSNMRDGLRGESLDTNQGLVIVDQDLEKHKYLNRLYVRTWSL